MPYYRKLPVVIFAEQWEPGKDVDGVDMVAVTIEGDSAPAVQTLEGPLFVAPGDYIVTGVRGERYPVKESIFEETYEEVLDA